MLCLGRYKHHKQGYAITSPLHQPDKLLCGIRQIMPVHIADAKCIAGAWIVKLDHIEVVSQLPVRQKIAGINRASIVVDTQII